MNFTKTWNNTTIRAIVPYAFDKYKKRCLKKTLVKKLTSNKYAFSGNLCLILSKMGKLIATNRLKYFEIRVSEVLSFPMNVS